MATLVLSAAGSAIGGPIGGSIGAMLGQQIDQRLFGPGPAQGPRLKELAFATSTYGDALPRHFGRMRTGGTIIWATELKEDADTSGGKGRPQTTTYSYSASFAVALGSGPVDRVGRIWADGNLLRGAAGDLKVPGTMRLHAGYRDQRPDPLIQAVEGAGCPAFRGRAYVVFEDLELADFGNRLPALSFEVFAGDGAQAVQALLDPLDGAVGAAPIAPLQGFSHEGGSYRQVLTALGEVHPLCPALDGGVLRLSGTPADPQVHPLAEAAAWGDGDWGRQAGQTTAHGSAGGEVEALRYYDVDRDYQPGLQRTAGRHDHGSSRQIEFPGSLRAAGARELADAAAQRGRFAQDALTWRMAELDPAIGPGSLVRAPGQPGVWRVGAWEWRQGGVELELVRQGAVHPVAQGGDAGGGWSPVDLTPGPSILRFIELPPQSPEDANRRALFAAVRSAGSVWKGAALYRGRQGDLIPLDQFAQRQANMGTLRADLPASPGLRFEPQGACEVEFAGTAPPLASATLAGLAEGANRVLVGGEVLQFADAHPNGTGGWRLAGLLRGRGGTEAVAGAGHLSGTPFVLLDNALTPLTGLETTGGPVHELAAIGRGDTDAVSASLADDGASLRPMPPVHGRARTTAAGELALRWTRRARGAWLWRDGVDVPLVEERERYLVGIGDPDAPVYSWTVDEPALLIERGLFAELRRSTFGQPIWVRQIGSFAQSYPSLLETVR